MNREMHPEARLEFREAFAYYKDCRDGLGLEFSREVYASISRIADAPLLWSRLTENSRRFLTKRFPYSIIYQVLDEGVLIVAVAHQKRKPGYWKDRLK
ncbi:MAG: type II toxin-antitoxin system RelE/ParE family toxin [Pyrinomonadaceae bacterium]